MARKPKPPPQGDSPSTGSLTKSAQAKAQDDQVMAVRNYPPFLDQQTPLSV